MSNILFPLVPVPDLPKCNLCGFDIQNSECGCGIPEEDTRGFLYSTPYVNHCWNCNSVINSGVCKLSLIPGMGYHCNTCGEDLLKWKAKMLGITPSLITLALG